MLEGRAMEDLSGTLEAAIEIAVRRKDTQKRLKTAIRARDWEQADQLITELVPDDEKVYRAVESINSRSSRRR